MSDNPAPPDNRTDRLGTERVGKLLLEFSIPAIVSMVFNTLYNVVDTIFLGQALPDGSGVAVTTLAFPVMTLLMGFSMIAGQGGNALAAIQLGKGEKDQVERTLGNSATLLAGIAFFLTQGGLPPLSWFVLPFAALPMLALLIALMIPFKLKFGGENGRLAMLLAIAAVCAIFGAALGLMQSMGISVQTITAVLPAMSMALSALLILVICALIVAISCGISTHIMEHREF